MQKADKSMGRTHKFKRKKNFYKKQKKRKRKCCNNEELDVIENIGSGASRKFDRKKKVVYDVRIEKRLGCSRKFEELNAIERKVVLMHPRVYRRMLREHKSKRKSGEKLRKCRPRHKDMQKPVCINVVIKDKKTTLYN